MTLNQDTIKVPERVQLNGGEFRLTIDSGVLLFKVL